MRHHYWKFIGFFMLFVACHNLAFAEGDQPLAPQKSKLPTAPGMGNIILQWVDRAHSRISRRILETSERFDTFFADERIEEETQNSQIKITTSVEINESGNTDITFPLGMDLALPHLKKRFLLSVETLLNEDKGLENGDKDEDKGDTKDEENDAGNKNEFVLSLRYRILQQARKWLSVDSGVKLNSDNVEPFGKLRVRRIFDFDPWALRLTQFIYWYKDDGWGETSRIDIDRQLHQNLLLRMASKAKWGESTKGVELTQSLLLRWRLSHNRAFEWKISGEGHTRPETVLDEHSMTVTFRRRLYKNWIFFEVESGVEFLREDKFTPTPLLMFDIELRFGDTSES